MGCKWKIQNTRSAISPVEELCKRLPRVGYVTKFSQIDVECLFSRSPEVIRSAIHFTALVEQRQNPNEGPTFYAPQNPATTQSSSPISVNKDCERSRRGNDVDMSRRKRKRTMPDFPQNSFEDSCPDVTISLAVAEATAVPDYGRDDECTHIPRDLLAGDEGYATQPQTSAVDHLGKYR